jgi:RNA polymerase sigma-70 factor (ECF subfamily)
MAATDECRLDATIVTALYAEHGEELRRFLLGVLRDPEAAGEAFQAAFARAVEQGHSAREETLKGWLFRVAFNEAMLLKRRQGVQQRATQSLAWSRSQAETGAEATLIRWETVAKVRQALEELPEDQRRVVRMRIYEDKTFAVIAEELGVPLGTALTRMQSALKRLRKTLDARDLHET